MQGIKRHHGVPKRVKLPITIALMRILKDTVANHPTICNHDKAILWSAFTLAFFGFLRVSEFVAPASTTFDPQCTLLTTDITCNTDLVIALKASKTNPFRRGCNIIIAPSQSSVCAVQAYQAYKALHSSVAHLPAFQFANSTFLMRQAVSNHIQDLLTRASVPDVNCYTTHSFRSGAATTAADANLPDWLIKALGSPSPATHHPAFKFGGFHHRPSRLYTGTHAVHPPGVVSLSAGSRQGDASHDARLYSLC
ncbi:uncharacterized protein LOC102807950 [Saccoglossus kowalevskii]